MGARRSSIKSVLRIEAVMTVHPKGPGKPAGNEQKAADNAARLAVRRHLDGISVTGPQWAHPERTETSRPGMDTVRFREVVRQTDPHHQRRGHADPRQFSRRAHVVSRAGHGAGIDLNLGVECAPARARRSALRQRPHHRGLPWQIGNETARRQEMETRSPSRRSVVEKIAHCRLRGAWRRQREEVWRVAGRN